VTQSHHLASTADAPSEASELLLQVADEWQLPDDLIERMLLTIGEAVGNAAEHGNELLEERTILVEFIRKDEEVLICVEDEGSGFSEQKLLDAHLPEDPFDTGGRGLYIMKEMTNRIWVEKGGRRLCLAWTLGADGT